MTDDEDAILDKSKIHAKENTNILQSTLNKFNVANSINKGGSWSALNSSKVIKLDDDTHHSEIVVLDAYNQDTFRNNYEHLQVENQ